MNKNQTKKTEISLSELAKKLLEAPITAPEPTIKPSTPGTKPGRPSPWRPPKTAPERRPKASDEDIPDSIQDIVDRLEDLNETSNNLSLTEMLNEIKRKDLVDKYVGKSKLLSADQFDVIESIAGGSTPVSLWLIQRLQDGSLDMTPEQLEEDAENWKKYLDIFKRKKNQFNIKNIQQIKTREQVEEFTDTAFNLLRKQEEDPTKRAGTKKQKFSELLVGTEGPYDIYKIPQHDSKSDKYKDDEGNNILYRVSCELGSGTSWCTATGNTDQWFNNYSSKGPLYIALDPSTGKKYQANIRDGKYHEFKNEKNRNPDYSDRDDHSQYLYRFLRDKEGIPIPFKAQLAYTPESIDWNGLAYDENDLNLIRDTNNMDKIAWDKVNQSDFGILKWVIQNSPENIDPENIDINAKGILGLIADKRPELINWDDYMIDSYVKAMGAVRHGGDYVNWDNIDYTNAPTISLLLKRKPEVIDKSQLDMNDERIASLFNN